MGASPRPSPPRAPRVGAHRATPANRGRTTPPALHSHRQGEFQYRAIDSVSGLSCNKTLAFGGDSRRVNEEQEELSPRTRDGGGRAADGAQAALAGRVPASAADASPVVSGGVGCRVRGSRSLTNRRQRQSSPPRQLETKKPHTETRGIPILLPGGARAGSLASTKLGSALLGARSSASYNNVAGNWPIGGG